MAALLRRLSRRDLGRLSASRRAGQRSSASDMSETGKGSLRALQAWWAERKPAVADTPPPEPCAPIVAELCGDLASAEGPEQIILFRQSFAIEPLSVDLGSPGEPGGIPPLELSCIPVAEADAAFGLDLRYEQRWFFERPLRGALSASVALAPGETLTLSIRNTQRKRFDRETLDEVERSESAESTIADRDVLNVTRSSSQTNNWNVSGNASLSLSGFGVGASGSMSQSVTEALSSSAQRTSESTRKSSENLKTLRKVQVKESSELTVEQGKARTIVNPYRDRTLRVDAYEMLKSYCVEFHVTAWIPAIALTVDRLTFDREFVLTNGAFLSEELIDRWLGAELTDALQGNDLRFATSSQGAQQQAEDVAWTALEFLFAGPDIFNWPSPLVGNLGAPLRPNNWDENQPDNSFREPLAEFSGYRDALSNKLGIVFTTLAYYQRLYRDEVLPANRELAVGVAMSLDQAVGPRWLVAEETDEVSQILDVFQATEVMRRLSGFLAMTSGMLRPLLQPAEAEQAARRAAEAAEFTIEKVIDHLNCHQRYYTERYLASMAQLTSMKAIHRLVEDVLLGRITGAGADLLEIFDAEASYLDAHTIVVPLRVALSEEELGQILERFKASDIDVRPRLLRVDQITVPTDGVHMESTAGACVLDDVPEAKPLLLPVQIIEDQ